MNVLHNLGATRAKAKSTLSFSLDMGTATSDWSADLRDLCGLCVEGLPGELEPGHLNFKTRKCSNTRNAERYFFFVELTN